jgi:hypothetical protein
MEKEIEALESVIDILTEWHNSRINIEDLRKYIKDLISLRDKILNDNKGGDTVNS